VNALVDALYSSPHRQSRILVSGSSHESKSVSRQVSVLGGHSSMLMSLKIWSKRDSAAGRIRD